MAGLTGSGAVRCHWRTVEGVRAGRAGGTQIDVPGDQEIRSSGDQEFRRYQDVAVAPDDDPCSGRGGGAGGETIRIELSKKKV